jgi:hypothetical protein
VAEPPAGIDLAKHRDFEGARKYGQWVRHVVLVLLAAFLAAALFNTFGEDSSTSTAASPAATLKMTAPQRVRGGLIYMAKFEIHAVREIKAPVLVLDQGWFDQTTVNAIQPEPEGSTSDAERVKYRFGPLSAGSTLTVFVDLQATPENVGSHEAGVALDDGGREIVSIHRTQLNFP